MVSWQKWSQRWGSWSRWRADFPASPDIPQEVHAVDMSSPGQVPAAPDPLREADDARNFPGPINARALRDRRLVKVPDKFRSK